MIIDLRGKSQKEREAIWRVQQVAATMAIEQMYFDKDFIEDMIKVEMGLKTTEEIRQEAIKKYVK
jgi:hypothetical protein